MKKQSEIERKTEALSIEIEFYEDTVKRFIEEFEAKITSAPEDIKKSWLKKCISEVIVDREAEEFRFNIRKVPAVTPELERSFTSHKPLTMSLANIVSAASSGGPL